MERPRAVYGQQGPREFLEFMRTWTEGFDWSIELERVVGAGEDRVVAVFHQRAIGKRSGVPFELRMALLYDLRQGRVIRMRKFLDPRAAGLSE